MSVYHKFLDQDILETTINAHPAIEVVSGTLGWRSNVGTSSSLSLYGGIRGRTVQGVSVAPVDPIDTHSIDKVIFVSGSYPATGSIHLVKVRKGPNTLASDINHDNWYESHFYPILGLYEHYSKYNPEYFTGSYDRYCLYFHSPLTGGFEQTLRSVSAGSRFHTSGTITVEAWIKPMRVTGSSNFFIVSKRNALEWGVFISGSGHLVYQDRTHGIKTSSFSLRAGEWQHIAVTNPRGIHAVSASFYLNGVLASGSLLTGSGADVDDEDAAIVIGTDSQGINPFHGYMFEVRLWNRERSATQISSSYNRRLFECTPATGTYYKPLIYDQALVSYIPMVDGPNRRAGLEPVGSGAFDMYWITKASVTESDKVMDSNYTVIDHNSSTPKAPLWQPLDHPDFTTWKTRIDNEVTMFKVIHVPSMFYGRQIATGSVRIQCNAYSNKRIRRVIVDDGRGSLYVSGSYTKDISGESYAGQAWNKVGNVFYTEGLMVITEPSFLDLGENIDSADPNDVFQLSFKGVNRIPSKVFMCRVPAAEANASNNPSFASYNEQTGHYEIKRGNTTYITAVGLYNEDRQLVAVAKLAQPIRKREKDKLNIRLRFDF